MNPTFMPLVHPGEISFVQVKMMKARAGRCSIYNLYFDFLFKMFRLTVLLKSLYDFSFLIFVSASCSIFCLIIFAQRDSSRIFRTKESLGLRTLLQCTRRHALHEAGELLVEARGRSRFNRYDPGRCHRC